MWKLTALVGTDEVIQNLVAAARLNRDPRTDELIDHEPAHDATSRNDRKARRNGLDRAAINDNRARVQHVRATND